MFDWRIAMLCLGVVTLALGAEEVRPEGYAKPSTNLYKVVLTQKGYIQFLRYELAVPKLDDFTFCIWVKTVNFEHPHPIFSYSRNENTRLIRAWLEPSTHGPTINLAILEQEVIKVPARITEGLWYHICQSWEGTQGKWRLQVNGKLAGAGQNIKLRGAVIPDGGDIVVGQEYTDFDKGLEDGIEGEVFGFNFLGGPARNTTAVRTTPKPAAAVEASQTVIKPALWGFLPFTQRPPSRYFRGKRSTFLRSPSKKRQSQASVSGDGVWRWGQNKAGRSDGLRNDWERLGQELVVNGYRSCVAGKGSPVADRKRLIISWSDTPVRVFGGAIIKNARPVCADF